MAYTFIGYQVVSRDSLLVQQNVAHEVLNMSASTFRRHVSIHLPKIKVGRSVFYRRVDLMRWIEDSFESCNRTQSPSNGGSLWESEKKCQDSSSVMGSGTSINRSMEGGYVEQLEKLREKLRRER